VPRRNPAEFRRRVLDLIAAGRPVAQVAADLDISAQVIYTWRWKLEQGPVRPFTTAMPECDVRHVW